MMQYDLTDTPIARSGRPLPPPSEAELLAVTVGLMLAEDCARCELGRRELVLTGCNYRRIATLVEERTPPLARDFGDARQLRRRLRALVGLRITTTRGAFPRTSPDCPE
ncbi:MAG: hypothetical protein HS101_18265 [Planctomycetia bacterium]|nr:hypothetical protein [Planctomycetia bacterium]